MAKRNPWRSVAIGSAIVGAFWWWGRKRQRVDRDSPPKRRTPTRPGQTPKGTPIETVEVEVELKDAWLSYFVEESADLRSGPSSTLRLIRTFSGEGKEWFRSELTVRYRIGGGAWSEPCELFAWGKTPLLAALVVLDPDSVTDLQSVGCLSPRPQLFLRVTPAANGDYAISLLIEAEWDVKVEGHLDVGSTTMVPAG